LTSPVFLIAAREFRTYVATVSFWVALAIGPLLMAGLLVLAGHGSAATPVRLICADSTLQQIARLALADAAKLEDHSLAFVQNERAPGVRIDSTAVGKVDVAFDANFPLTQSGRALVALRMERDLIRAGSSRNAPMVRLDSSTAGSSRVDTAALSRFGMVTVLWLALTGSLGMLLQAIVRERGNRSLESLLAAVSAWQLAAGKLLGIGAISALVLFVWLGSASPLAVLALGSGSLASPLLSAFASPIALARGFLIYTFAYAFYGFTTVAIGAGARDSASAQNLSRPMFLVLLMAFFVSLASVSGVAMDVSWLVYVPPFAPFVLLLKAPGEYPVSVELTALALLFLCTLLAARLAVARITVTGDARGTSMFRRFRTGFAGQEVPEIIRATVRPTIP